MLRAQHRTAEGHNGHNGHNGQMWPLATDDESVSVTDPITWCDPPIKPRLNPGDVHVWLAALHQSPGQLTRLAAVLAPDERDRAARFHFERDRHRFAAARGLLRHLLASYLACAPDEVRLAYGAHGKPLVAPRAGDAAVRFNVSHSHEYVVYAFSLTQEVGIDIERLQLLPEAERVVEHFFSPAERQALYTLPHDERVPAFFRCWTRKEAYLKAIGAGLATLPLDRFDVSVTAEAPALERVEGQPQEAARWLLHNVPPPPGYAATLAVEGRPQKIVHWRWRWPCMMQ